MAAKEGGCVDGAVQGGGGKGKWLCEDGVRHGAARVGSKFLTGVI